MSDEGNSDRPMNQETINTMTEIARDQIRPNDPQYLDDMGELQQAVDIGRRVIKRKREGGRPSKVEDGISRIEPILKWYGGDQRRQYLVDELREIRDDMSYPTWVKFAERANEVLANELDEPMDVSEAISRPSTGR